MSAKKKTVRITFTKKAIAAIPPPAKGFAQVHDIKTPGLVLVVTANDARTYYVYKKVDRKPIRHKLGRIDELTIEQARKLAAQVKNDIASGKNPQARKKSKRDGAALADLFAHWIAHAKQHKKTWKEDERKWNTYFGRLQNRRLADVSQNDVATWHRKLGEKHGPYLANRARALLSAMFNKAGEIGYDGRNPCDGVKRFREESRERFLLPDEMKPFFLALKAEPPAWRDFWLLCLFTGGRRGNVASMAWKELDLTQGIWYLPGEQMKNGLPLAIVLPPPAMAVLQTRHAERNGSDYVFSTATATGHIVDPRKSWARVTKAAGLSDLRPHDLRRSLGSWQAIAGASLQVIGELGHRDPKATAVYARLQMDPVRTSVNGAVAAMLEAAKPKTKKQGGRNRDKKKNS